MLQDFIEQTRDFALRHHGRDPEEFGFHEDFYEYGYSVGQTPHDFALDIWDHHLLCSSGIDEARSDFQEMARRRTTGQLAWANNRDDYWERRSRFEYLRLRRGENDGVVARA